MKKHLFLKLYKHNHENIDKPMTEFINDFDKTIPLFYNPYGNVNETVYAHFRNFDDLFLEHKCVQSLWFTYRYLKYLQNNNLYQDINIQEIFKLALLTDKDTKPKTDVFKFAYISDIKREEIKIYSDYYRLLLWDSLHISDLEFNRRVKDILHNSVPSNKSILLDDGISFTNPFVDYDKSKLEYAIGNGLNERLIQNNNERRILETKLISDLGMPDSVLFDGSRFTIIIPNSPISLMFDVGEYIENKKFKDVLIKESDSDMKSRSMISYNVIERGVTNKNIKPIEVSHPCVLQPAFMNREVSERCGAFWNGRSAWDFTFRNIIENAIMLLSSGGDSVNCINNMKLISFILLLKNDGLVNGIKASDIIFEYRKKRSELSDKYIDVSTAQLDICKSLFNSHIKRGVCIIYEAHNGYISVEHKPYNLSDDKKIQTNAIFYDKNFKKIGVSSFYTDFVLNKTLKLVKDSKKNKHTMTPKDIMIEQTYKLITRDTRILAIDYISVNRDIQVKNYVDLVCNDDGTIKMKPQIYQIELFNSNFIRVSSGNSLCTYVGLLIKQIKTNGYANVKNYSKVLDIINKVDVHEIESDDYHQFIEQFGAETPPSFRRDIIYYSLNGEYLNCEDYSALNHVEFVDVKYSSVVDYVRNKLNDDDEKYKRINGKKLINRKIKKVIKNDTRKRKKRI